MGTYASLGLTSCCASRREKGTVGDVEAGAGGAWCVLATTRLNLRPGGYGVVSEAFVPQPFDYLELGAAVPPLGKRISTQLQRPRPCHPLQVERYERTWEQCVEYGLNDPWKPAQQWVGREEGLARLVDLIRDSHKILFLTGAGVSTESGIPAFRDNGGVMGGFTIWGKYSEKHELFQNFVAEEEARVNYWKMHGDLYAIAADAQPNPSHHIAAYLASKGRLLGVLTQNIDGLYLKAGLDPSLLVELHGTATRARCLGCDATYPMDATVARLAQGEPVPHCRGPAGCGGVLKPDTVSFGQRLSHANVTRARRWLEACDLLVVMGSSLRVQPVNRYPTISLDKRTPLVVANMEDTQYDEYAQVLLNDDRCGAVMAALQEQLQKGAVL